MARDWVALGAGQEEWVPSWVLPYFWVSPWGWLCPGGSRNRARGGTGQKTQKELLLRKQGEDSAMDLTSMSLCTKKADSPPKTDAEPPRAGRAR